MLVMSFVLLNASKESIAMNEFKFTRNQKQIKIQKLQKTKTKTGGGEHLRFADGDATPETRGGDDSDMGTESGDTQTAEETETR